MTDPSRRSLQGVFLCLFVGFSFACGTALASVAYSHGANALTVLSYRTLLAVIVLFLVLKTWRVPVALPARKRWIAIALGVLLAAYSYGLLGAIHYLPVALAVLTFYLYPMLIGLASWALGIERMTPALAIALVVAFGGLALALDAGGGTLNLTGFALAFGAAALLTVLMLINVRVVGRDQDSRPVSLHMLATATLVYLAVDLMVGTFPLPQSTVGWAAFIGSGLFYSFSIVGIFVAVSWIGPIRSSIYMNMEPISSVVLGTVVLGQAMKSTQLLGAALVIAAVVFTAVKKAGDARPPVKPGTVKPGTAKPETAKPGAAAP